MRVGRVLTVLLVGWLLGACGRQALHGQEGPGATPHRSGIVGMVHLGPQCAVDIGADACRDKPSAGSTVTVTRQHPVGNGAGEPTVAQTTTDADGRYRVALRPGRYVVTAHAGMSCRPIEVRVATGTYSKVDLRCDTGIR